MSWYLFSTAPSCSVSDPALRPVSHMVLIFSNNFFSLFGFVLVGVGGVAGLKWAGVETKKAMVSLR